MGSVIDVFDLFKGAVISVESHRGKKEVWVSIGSQHFPLVITATSAKKQRSGLSSQVCDPLVGERIDRE